MIERNIDRLYEVIDGVVYDSEDCSLVHRWRGKMGSPYAVWCTPDGHYFMTKHGLSLLFGPHFKFAPIDRIYAVELAAAHDAPDWVLEGLGVELARVDESDEVFQISPADTVWTKRTRFGERVLLKNVTGRYLMSERSGMFGVARKRTSPMSQREAIAWALENDAWGEALDMLGIGGPRPAEAEIWGRAQEARVGEAEFRAERAEMRALEAENRLLRTEVEMLKLKNEDRGQGRSV